MFGKKQKQIDELTTQLAELQNIITQAGGGDLAELARQVIIAREEHHKTLENLERETQHVQSRLEATRQSLNDAQNKLTFTENHLRELQSLYSDTFNLAEAGFGNYDNPAQNSLALQDELKRVQNAIKQEIRNKTATSTSPNFTFNNSAAKGRKFCNDMAKMMLRAYNAECENCILTVKAGNGETARKRLDRARDQVSKLGTLIELKITPHYHSLRLQELKLTLEYQNAKKREKEEERERRAQLREEARAQKELEAEREKLRKEQAHYQKVYDTLISQGKTEEAEAIKAKLDEISTEVESIDYRAANIRAGYVYVISNIGSFGERMVKIGMTRRLEPMDRIRELSDASVPFNFDVHALFFSDDAVSVENQLHHRFAKERVNLINARREFFNVTPLEVKEALKEIAGNLLEFEEIPAADQYRESIALRETL